MSECYLGEIRMFAGSFAPQGWAFCNGQLLAITENEALFTLLGTTYGGNGQTTFGLPDLQGRIPIHSAPTYPLGASSGTETVTLTENQLPTHTHTVHTVATAGNASSPNNTLWAGTSNYSNYSNDPSSLIDMDLTSVLPSGGNQSHNNMMPSLVISFIISLYGIFPSQQ